MECVNRRNRFYLFTVSIIFLVVIVACKEGKNYEHTYDEKVKVRLSRADVNINNRESIREYNVAYDIINIVEEPILIQNQEYYIPKECVAGLSKYLLDNTQKIDENRYSEFIAKYEEGIALLQRHNDNNLKDLNQEDRTVLYYIAKSALRSLDLDLTYNVINGQINVADKTGNVVYENQSYTENTRIDYNLIVIVTITIGALYALYFVFVFIKRGNLHTTERAYEKVNI
jgi:hypothetical protein